MRGSEGTATGRTRAVRRIAGVAGVALAVAGCGGSSHSQTRTAPRLAPALAGSWAREAEAIADAAAAGDGCRARRLADGLRGQVIDSSRVPARLRAPLLGSVNSLAERIACSRVTVTLETTATVPEGPPDKHGRPPKPPHGGPHGPHGHHKGPGGDRGKKK